MGEIRNGDALEILRTMPDECVQMCVTSPPYWGLRDYGVDGQIGLEKSPDEYVERLVDVFREVNRVLKDDGTLWVNLGDSYYGGGNNRGNKKTISAKQATNRGATGQVGNVWKSSERYKPKDLIGVPWRVAFALQKDGWYLRSDIIWHKPNPMPESVTDRPTKAHEYLFLLAKSEKYFYDVEATKEATKQSSLERMTRNYDGDRRRGMPDKYNPHTFGYFGKSGNKERKQRPNSDTLGKGAQAGSVPWEDKYGKRNRRSVWTITTKSFKGAHFATFPPDLIEPCIKAGSRPGDVVLDPFFGAGTTGLVAQNLARDWIGIELNPEYCEIARERIGLDAHILEGA